MQPSGTRAPTHPQVMNLQDVPLISKSNAKQQYLVSDNDLLPLRWLERNNPQRASWTSMKLYLEREVQVWIAVVYLRELWRPC
jgi:hypothetical protein